MNMKLRVNRRKHLEMLIRHKSLLLLAVVGVLSLSGCSKEHADIQFSSEYQKLGVDNTSSFNHTIQSINQEINNKITELVQSKISEELPLKIDTIINGDKFEYDLTDDAVVDGVMVTYKDKKYLWDGSTKALVTFKKADKSYNGIDILVSKHYNYVDGLNKILDEVSKYNYLFKRPKFEFTGSALRVVEEGSTGMKVNIDKLKSDFMEMLNKHESGEIQVECETTYPDVSSEQINEINTRLSSYSTNFTPSASRGGNIAVATSRINGKLLAPGETLSVDKTILSRNAANGYFKAGSYLNGQTVQTYGGGVCQVSTTLYGAIIRTGLIPIERNAHSMAVHYAPLGLDAAISEGYKDLKITNTYDRPIYIQGITSGGRLTFNVYGASDLLGGYTYKPRSTVSKNGLSADSWLQKLDGNGNVVSEVHLFKSSYRPHG